MNRFFQGSFLVSACFPLLLCGQDASPVAPTPTGQSMVFFHPDGTSLSGWNIYRVHQHGPDAHAHWDLLPRIAVYRSHMRDHLDASSHGGGTIHAYGRKVLRDSYGMNGTAPVEAASGHDGSVMMEALAAGMTVGIVNSGHLAEPGTGCFLASVEKRDQREEIAAQLIESGADLIFGGGEVLFLPRGVEGRHGLPGVREDGRNLIAEAEEAGYQVLYTAEDLDALSADQPRLLGLFAAEDTYNALSEEELKEQGLPLYQEGAPSIARMTEAALKWCRARSKPYFLMIEEEGTDNFANATNAPGTLEAYRRADEAIAVIRKQVAAQPDLTLLVAADSEAGCAELIGLGLRSDLPEGETLRPLPGTTATGSPLDGVGGTGTLPFVSAPDQFGQRHVFAIAWGDRGDHYGSVLARAEGSRADLLPINLDNTEVYHFLRKVMFTESR